MLPRANLSGLTGEIDPITILLDKLLKNQDDFKNCKQTMAAEKKAATEKKQFSHTFNERSALGPKAAGGSALMPVPVTPQLGALGERTEEVVTADEEGREGEGVEEGMLFPPWEERDFDPEGYDQTIFNISRARKAAGLPELPHPGPNAAALSNGKLKRKSSHGSTSEDAAMEALFRAFDESTSERAAARAEAASQAREDAARQNANSAAILAALQELVRQGRHPGGST